MIPPTSIDGTDITSATIDGTDVQEITVDGQTVFSSGPELPLSLDFESNPFDNWTSVTQGSSFFTTGDSFEGNQAIQRNFDGTGAAIVYKTAFTPPFVFTVKSKVVGGSFDRSGGIVLSQTDNINNFNNETPDDGFFYHNENNSGVSFFRLRQNGNDVVNANLTNPSVSNTSFHELKFDVKANSVEILKNDNSVGLINQNPFSTLYIGVTGGAGDYVHDLVQVFG